MGARDLESLQTERDSLDAATTQDVYHKQSLALFVPGSEHNGCLLHDLSPLLLDLL